MRGETTLPCVVSVTYSNAEAFAEMIVDWRSRIGGDDIAIAC
jgi:hypothetical protein